MRILCCSVQYSLPFFLMVLCSLWMHFIIFFMKSSPSLGSRILWINKLILSKIKNHLSGWFWFLWLAYSSVVLIVYLYVSVKFIFFILLHHVCPSFGITFRGLDEKIALLGAIQSLFEGSMYTFVFLWTPALSPNDEDIPHGFIFATFMLASMMGSSLASRLMARSSPKVESYMQIVFAVSSVSLLLPIVTSVCHVSIIALWYWSSLILFWCLLTSVIQNSSWWHLPRWKVEASHLQAVFKLLASVLLRLVWEYSGRPLWKWDLSTFQRRPGAPSWTSSAFLSIFLCALCCTMYVCIPLNT